MRIFTYPSPFEINKNRELWDIVTKHPHFCASDTLVQGLEAEYGRTSFGFLRTVQSLIDRVLGEYTDNPQNDIQIFLTVSNIIRALPDNEMKSAFRFNVAEVVEAVKFLAMLECDVTKFNVSELIDEQKVLLEIYRTVMNSPCMERFENLTQISKDDFIRATRSTINHEIEYLCNRSPEMVEELAIARPIRTPRDGYQVITKMINYLKEKSKDAFSPTVYAEDLARAEYILSLIKDTDDRIFEKIIIHGVHKITPTIYFLFKLLDQMGIEIIFLINYARNMPNMYQTWRDVYAWCNTKFEYLEDLDLTKGRPLGVALANIVEGKKQTVFPKEEIMIFSNLTSFTVSEVRQTFKKSGENLNKMKTQYYAVRGDSSNEILKMYFPEQFNQKPFLSYPIGQFILGIYQMWDFEANTLKLSDKHLCECAVSNLFSGNGTCNVFEVINKTKLYFSDIETTQEYYMRIKELDTALHILSRNNRYASLKRLSFFSISFAELAELKAFVEFIETIANQLFKDVNPMVDFGKHFKTLMEIISIPTMDNNTLSQTERSLISEITERLTVCNEGEVAGGIEDVKDALCFYLATSKRRDTSNWIVRDFEQIEGAVLLHKKSKANDYHFALLSNSHMTNQNDDVLSWPLTNDMFLGYTDVESAVPVITKGLLERRNFLKFALFYGLFFTKCNLKLSYIEEENGEKQTLYYLLHALGLKANVYREESVKSFETEDEPIKPSSNFSSDCLEREAKELFSICPYKYLQNEVIQSPIEYCSDYHIKYYVANFMYTFIKDSETLSRADVNKSIHAEFNSIQKLFPFWEKIVFLDIEKNVRSQIDRYLENLNADTPPNPVVELQYKKRKENFLIAQWTDLDNGTKHMNFKKENLNDKIENYMLSNQLYPNKDELPHKKVCENCNYSEVCLRNYYEVRSSGNVT